VFSYRIFGGPGFPAVAVVMFSRLCGLGHLFALQRTLVIYVPFSLWLSLDETAHRMTNVLCTPPLLLVADHAIMLGGIICAWSCKYPVPSA